MRVLKLFLSFGIGLVLSGSIDARAQATDAKPVVGVQCAFRDESVLGCAGMIQFIQDSLDGITIVSDPSAPVSVTLSDQALGDNVEYSITASAPSGSFMIRIQLPRTADDRIRKERLIAPIRDFLSHLVNEPLTSGDDGGSWFFDITGNARFSNNGKTNSSYGGGLYNLNAGSFPRVKFENVNNLDFSASNQIISGTREGISGLLVGSTVALTYSLNDKKHWNAFLITGAEHSPAQKNINFSTSGTGGIEWNLVPIRDQGQPTQVRVQGTIGVVHNQYRLRTIFDRLHETFASGGASIVFIVYSKDSRLKTTGNAGFSIPLRAGGEKVGTYSAGVNLSYQIRPSKPAVRLDGNFSIRYRELSLTDPDPSIALPAMFYNLYWNSPGFSTYARIGLAITLGNARKRSQDQRGPGL